MQWGIMCEIMVTIYFEAITNPSLWSRVTSTVKGVERVLANGPLTLLTIKSMPHAVRSERELRSNGYEDSIRSLSGGRASYSMMPARSEPTPVGASDRIRIGRKG